MFSSSQSRARGTKAFTLLELIVTLVVLGLLSAIAIPTFSRVINNSKDATTEASLAAVGRNAQALTRFDASDDLFTSADATTAITEASWKAVTADAPLVPGSVKHALVDSGTSLMLATVSASGHCVLARVDLKGVTTEVRADDEPCEPAGPTVVDPDGNSDGETSSGEAPVEIPVMNYSVTPTSSPDSLTLTWNAVDRVSAYKVEVTGPGFTHTAEVAAAGATLVNGVRTLTYTVSSLTAGSAYTYTVSPTTPGPKPVTGTWSTVPGTTAFFGGVAPTVRNAETSTVTTTLRWSAVAGADGYRIYRGGTAEENLVSLATGGATTTLSGIPMATASSSVFYIRAYNSAGSSNPSAARNVVNPHHAPVLTRTVTHDSDGVNSRVSLSWVANNASGPFKVLRASKSDMSDAVTIYTGSATNFSDPTALTPNQVVYYQVVGVFNGQDLKSSSLSTPGIPLPPTDLTATKLTSTTYRVTATAPANAGYAYSLYENGAKVGSGFSSIARQDVEVAPGTTRTFTFRAYHNDNSAGLSKDSAPITISNP